MTIIKYPDKVLRQKTLPVEKITQEIFEFSDQIIKTMLEYDGVGLAANQMGRLLSIFAINLKPFKEEPEPVVMINPRIIKKEDIVEDEEGCLSFPNLFLQIPRFKHIVVHYQNLFNEKIILEAQGLIARAIQHEYDHLNGILFIDYVKENEKEKLQEYLLGLNGE